MDLAKQTLGSHDLSKYDFKILIDKSGSMSADDCKDSTGKRITRWQQAHNISKAIAEICNKFDDDGIDIILFDNQVIVYNGVPDTKVDEIFRKNSPSGSTDTDKAIKAALPEYFPSTGGIFKNLFGTSKQVIRVKPIILLIFTDGAPNNQQAVVDAIINVTKQISSRNDVSMSFLQLGDDHSARVFLKKLDDDLIKVGAKFDIVDTKNYNEMLLLSAEDIILQALTD